MAQASNSYFTPRPERLAYVADDFPFLLALTYARLHFVTGGAAMPLRLH